MLMGEVVTTVPNGRMTCFVNVDSYENKQLAGTIYSPHYKYSRAYSSMVELILLMEELFNDVMPPKSWDRLRTFSGEPEASHLWDAKDKVQVDEGGKLSTFKIDVLFRQRASWQGVICWLENNHEECFRSVLELIELLDSAVNSRCVHHAAAKTNDNF